MHICVQFNWWCMCKYIPLQKFFRGIDFFLLSSILVTYSF